MPNTPMTILMKTTNHIDLSDAEQVSYWSQAYGCTVNDLRNAVSIFGDSEERLRDFFEHCFERGVV